MYFVDSHTVAEVNSPRCARRKNGLLSFDLVLELFITFRYMITFMIMMTFSGLLSYKK